MACRSAGRALFAGQAWGWLLVVSSLGSVHRLKVTLRQVKPPVWRRIEVPSTTRLSELAGILEAAMGWLGGHLHAFEHADGTLYEPPSNNNNNNGYADSADERKVRVGQILPAVGSKLRWAYDFGDGWEHDLTVEAIEPRNPKHTYPRCTGGRRACPPEDCGGPWGYHDLLTVLTDPTHPQHHELAEWAPPGFDPTAFNPLEATQAMQSPRPLHGW